MARWVFPDEAARAVYNVVGVPDAPWKNASGSRFRIYTNVTATVLADIQTLAGATIAGSEIEVGDDSLLPEFLGPDEVKTLYGRSIEGGVVFPLYPRFSDRLAPLEAHVGNASLHGSTISGSSDLSLVGATVGKVVAVSAVDGQGVPTAWSLTDVGTQVELDAHAGAPTHPYTDVAKTWTATQTFLPTDPAAVPVTIQSPAGHTNALTKWLNSAGANRAILANTGRFQVDDGGASAAGYGFLGDNGGSGMYRPTTGQVAFSAAGNEVARFHSTRRVKVGGNASTAPVATIMAEPSGSADLGEVVRGAAGQTADLQQYQDSAGTVLVQTTAAGKLGVNRNPSAMIETECKDAGTVALNIRAKTGQTASIAVFYGAAGVAAVVVDRFGALKANDGLEVKWQNTDAHNVYAVTSGDTNLFQPRAAAQVVMGVRGLAGQSVDLIRFEDSAQAVLSKVDQLGRYYVPVGAVATPGIGFAGDEDTGFYSTGANVLAATSGGVQGWYMNNSEFVTKRSLWVQGRGTASDVLAIVKSVVGQTGDLQQWQDSAGVNVARINQQGKIVGSQKLQIDNADDQAVLIQAPSSHPYIDIQRGSNESLRLRTNSGSLYHAIGSSGAGNAINIRTGAGAYVGINLPDSIDLALQQFGVKIGSTVRVGIATIGIVGQTGSHQEWRDSAGVVLTKVNPGGELEFTDQSRGPVLRGPTGTRWRLRVDDAGVLETVAA